jgi:Cu/Ag efflux pump CusA
VANKMACSYSGVTFGFQQPIQMRFNELMTGVRQDVAVAKSVWRRFRTIIINIC